MIRVTDTIAIDNKPATAVQVRFDVRGSPSLPDEVRARLEWLAGRRLTQERSKTGAAWPPPV